MKKLLFWFTLCALPAGISHCELAHAAAPCIDTDLTYHEGKDVITTDGACKVWFCSGDHTWHRIWLCGTWDEITQQMFTTLRQIKDGPQAARDAAWDSLPTVAPGSTTPDARLVAAALQVPAPTDPPVEGLVTQYVDVYKQRLALNTYSLVKYGTIALGLPCDPTHRVNDATLGTLYAIDNSKVQRSVLLDPLPVVLYARCLP